MTQQTAQGGAIPKLTLGWRMKMTLGDLSVQEMADNLGVSRATISRWMSDKGTPPRRAFLLQWAMATGVDFDWLTTGTQPTNGPDGGGNEVTRWYPAVDLPQVTTIGMDQSGDGVSANRYYAPIAA